MIEGVRPVSPNEIIQGVAAEYDVEELDIHRMLRLLDQFVVQDHRDKGVWLSATPIKGASWAQRAPEARWEALRAVWLLKDRDPRSFEPHDSVWDGDRFSPQYGALRRYVWEDFRVDDFELWRFRQYAAIEPAVVAIDVPKSDLPNGGAKLIIGTQSVPELNVTAEIPAGWIREITLPGRWVLRREAIGLLGVSEEEFRMMIRKNALPEFHENPEGAAGFWLWHDLELLCPQR